MESSGTTNLTIQTASHPRLVSRDVCDGFMLWPACARLKVQ